MNLEPVIYTPVYNDAEALRKSADTMVDVNYKRLVIDGRYHGFDRINDSDVSTDDIVTLCKEKGWDYVTCAPCLEQEKFNLACDILGNRGDMVMILLSADEWIGKMGIADKWIRRICDGCEYPMMFMVQIIEHVPNHMYSQSEKALAKIFYHPKKIENKNTHWTTYVRGTNKILMAYPTFVPTMTLHHNNHLRSEERDELMIKFQDTNIPRERKLHTIIGRDRFYGI
jgi:hypothetical protein